MRWAGVISLAVLALGLAAAGPAPQSDTPPRTPPRRLSPDATLPAPAQSARRGLAITITEPADQAIVMGPARIAADVESDEPERISQVEFYADESLLFVDREPPYETVHDFGNEPRRTVVRAVAVHTAGFTVEDSVVTRELQLGYTVEVRRVVITVTVTDDEGAPVAGLTRDDFKVEEDGQVQEILEFAVEQRPLRLALVLDTSGSMRTSLTQVQLAAAGFLDVLRAEDRAMVVDFDDQVMLLQDLTDRRKPLRDAIMSTYARGGTAMYDAVHATLRRLATAGERKAIVVLSDGGDTASVFDRGRALEATRTSDVLIYTIGLGGADRSVLKDLSREAGGRAFFVGDADELAGTYQRIADELRNQYVVTYSSTNPEYDGQFRRIKVTYVGQGGLGYDVRARRGYYAVRTRARPLEQGRATPEEPDPEPAAEPAAAGSPASGGAEAAPPPAG